MTGEKNAAAILERASACELAYLSPLAQIVVTEDVPWLLARHLELLAALKQYVSACREQGLALGSITGDAEAAITKAEGAQ